ncbi:MAG: glycosyltransferase family 39 protein [Anaerolineae bacterium]
MKGPVAGRRAVGATSQRLARWGGVALLVGALAVRLYRLEGQSLWADEGNSAAQALRSLPEIAQRAAADIHPPLYYWALHLWARLFGTGEAALRGLSVVAGVMAVWAVWAWARRVGGEAAGILSGLLAALSPFAVAYSQEARMYMLLAALANAGFLLLTLHLEAERQGRTPPLWLRGAYVVTCTAGLYTHYTFPLVWATYNLAYGLSFLERPLRQRWKARCPAWVLLQGAVGILYAPWLPTALGRLAAWPSVQAPLPPPQALRQAWDWLVAGPCPGVSTAPRLLGALGVAVLGAWVLAREASQPEGPGLGNALLPLLAVALPVGAIVALDLGKPAYFKFLLVADGPLAVLLARGCWPRERSALRGRRAQAWRAAWLLVGLGVLLEARGEGLRAYFGDAACARDDYRGMATYIAAVARPGDAVLLNAPGQEEVFRYYDRSGLPVYPLPRQRPPNPAETQADLEAIAREHRRIFALFWATDESDPDRLVETWLDQHGYKAMDAWQGNVRFVVYALPTEGQEAPWVSLQARFGEGIWLRRYALAAPQVAPGDILQVAFLWEAEERPSERYKVTVQVLDGRNQVLAQRDAEPVGNARPTTTWAPGEEIQDHYGLLIPFGTPPGPARVLVALYRPEDGARLTVEGPGSAGDHLLLSDPVEVVRPAAPPLLAALPLPAREARNLGDLAWLGCRVYPRGWEHEPERPFFAGDAVHLDCYWQVRRAPLGRWRLEASLLDAREAVVARLEEDLASEAYPTTAWTEGEVVRGQHDLPLVGVEPGAYRLNLLALSPEGEAIPLVRRVLDIAPP